MTKLDRPVVLLLCVASLVTGALACNLLADNKFRAYDDGGCEFVGKDTTCGACIAQKCGSRVDAICKPAANSPTSSVLGQIEACAADGGFAPDARGSSACLVETAAGASTAENDAFNCVYKNCVDVADTPCVVCKLPGKLQDGGTTDLRSGPCGACLLDSCANVINSACCGAAIVVNSVASCADPKSATCKSLIAGDGGLAGDGGKRDAEGSECVAQTVACARECAQKCN